MSQDGYQAGYALVAAAFVTGLWAWVSQRAKSGVEGDDREATLESQNRQNLLQNYRDFNAQLQKRLVDLNIEIENIWAKFREMQIALANCERNHLEASVKIMQLEAQNKEQARQIGNQEDRLHVQELKTEDC